MWVVRRSVRKVLVGTFLASAASGLFACGQLFGGRTPPTTLRNMDFEQASNDRPQDWEVRVQAMSGSYELSSDPNVKRSGERSARLSGQETQGRAGDDGRVSAEARQCTGAVHFAGARLNYVGFLKTQDVAASEPAGGGMLWFDVEGPDGTAAFSRNEFRTQSGVGPRPGERALRGTLDWVESRVSIETADSAERVCFGFRLSGSGTLWADDFRIEVVSTTS
jgi:hypothetical protein